MTPVAIGTLNAQILISVNQPPLERTRMIPEMEQRKYKINPEYKFMPKSKEVLKI